MSTHNAPGFVSGLKAFFDNPLYTDLTLVCGGEQFKVHRMLLHEQSPVFRKMLSGGFAETNQKVIVLQDDPETMRPFLKYLYAGRYDDSTRGDTPATIFAVTMYAMADKYDFDPLRKVAARKLGEVCDPALNPQDFIDAVYAVDTSTAPGDLTLWNVVIPIIKNNISVLSDCPAFMKMATLDIPDLANVLFKSMDKSATMVVFRSNQIALPSKPAKWGGKEEAKPTDVDGDGDEDEEMFEQREPKSRFGPGRRLGDA